MHSNPTGSIRSLAIGLTVSLSATLILAGCGGSGGNGSSFSISGEVSGLASGETVVLNDGEGTLNVDSNGNFTLTRSYGNGDDYSITVSQHPDSQGCLINNGTVRAIKKDSEGNLYLGGTSKVWVTTPAA